MSAPRTLRRRAKDKPPGTAELVDWVTAMHHRSPTDLGDLIEAVLKSRRVGWERWGQLPAIGLLIKSDRDREALARG